LSSLPLRSVYVPTAVRTALTAKLRAATSGIRDGAFFAKVSVVVMSSSREVA
jgi:hypothetical protein